VLAPEVVREVPNIDHRHGDGRAEVIGIAVLEPSGTRMNYLLPDSDCIVRISIEAKDTIAVFNVGFMLRNHLGVDFAGTNTVREGVELPTMQAGDIYTVDFHLKLPALYPGSFSFSPAIADGTLINYRMADWIDNAITLQMQPGDGQVYGYVHLPCRVEVNGRITGKPVAEERLA
jgi:hypothetical protein